jgi:hypothetical protein
MQDDRRLSNEKPAVDSDAERLLDQAIELTFPASDPIAVDDAFASARQRERMQEADHAPRPQAVCAGPEHQGR